MAAPLALAAVLALAAGATADVDFGVYADGRSTTIAPSGATAQTRGGFSLAPQGSFAATGAGLRASTAYSARFWSADAVNRPSPLVDQSVDVQVGTYHDAPWNLDLRANGTRGATDPLADPLQWTAARQYASTAPLYFESARAEGHVDARLDERTTLGGSASWSGMRAADAAAQGLIPTQMGIGLDLQGSRRVTELDTVRASVTAGGSRTQLPGPDIQAEFASASLAWRRRLADRLEGWVGGGLGVSYTDDPSALQRVQRFPVGEAGLTREGTVSTTVVVGVAPGIDPYSGVAKTYVNGRCSFQWRLTDRIEVLTGGVGTGSTDGVTTVASGDIRLRWETRPRLSFELGAVATWQEDRRPSLPSFFEAGMMLGVRYATGRPR